MHEALRPCPLCTGSAAESAYPYAIHFDGQRSSYYCCADCHSVFEDPVPSEPTFAMMYAKSAYHDCHYAESENRHYAAAATLLTNFAPAGAAVLDYGCGFGHFLRAVRKAGFCAYGIEFDAEAAQAAAHNAGCAVWPVQDLSQHSTIPIFDVLHLGDVLEHLPDPAATLKQLLQHLKPGGLLFIEGPLEVNPSPVYWASRAFGPLKHKLHPGFVGPGKPRHLFHTGCRQQLAFFQRVAPGLERMYWEIYETGWPYASGGVFKRLIARVALLMGGRRLGGWTFGNRFTGIFRYPVR